jgi:pyruvate,water dikinase
VTAARFARENFRISRRVESFERVFEADRRRIGDMDLRVLSPIALDQTLTDVERLLDEAGSVMLTAYGNLLSSVVLLQGVLRTVARDRADLLQRELLTGLADVESAAPGLALWHIAEMASADEPTRARVRDADPASLHIADLDPGPTRRALENFIEAYGHRGPREAEIAEPRWREDPSLLFVALRLHLRREHDREQERPIDVERRQRAVRERAEREIEQLLPAPGRAAFRHLLGLVQRFTRLRERLRSHVVEVLGMFRRVALDASRRLGEAEEVAGREAAFFLTMEELHAALRGQARHVGELVRQRRRQYERDRALPDPPDTFIGFPPPVPPPPPETDALDGLAASAGRVQGRARVLSDTADLAHLEEGDILVAHCADVGWSPLFLLAGGVVTDLGGPLSHASIVLREYGVPAVVNVKVGTRIIRTGDWLDVDADAGRVQIVRSARGADDEPHPPGAELERP